MSTVSTSLNSSATIILTDYYRRYFNKNSSEKSSMKVLYLSTLVTGTAGVVIALSLVGVESALDAWWSLASIFSGGMLGLFLLGYISKKAGNPEAVTGVIAGVLLIIWMSLSPLIFTEGTSIILRSPFHTNLTIVFGTMTIFLVGFVITKIFYKK
jgi:SSS family solute:Na+ symporter